MKTFATATRPAPGSRRSPASRSLKGPDGTAAIRQVLHSPRPQAKLTVGAPDDAFEREADHVADRVMRMPDPEVEAASAPPRMQRLCAECEAERENEEVRAKEEPGETPEIPNGFAQRFAALHGGGRPLPAAERAFFEPRFGRDFAGVRLHSGPAASELAGSVHARAFTLGDAIVFGRGQYAPGTSGGRQLLAHELTHVVQQGGAAPERVQRLQGDLAKGASTEFLEADWRDVSDLGIVYKEGTVAENGGANLRKSPGGELIRWLPQNTKVFILKESTRAKVNAYAVSVINPDGGAGEFGYINKDYIWRRLPDPDSDVLKIKPGQSPIEIAAAHYAKKGFNVWSKDTRYVVNALVWVNQRAIHNARGTSGISKDAVDDKWYTAKSTAGVYIWLPGVDFMNAIYDKVVEHGGGTGSITGDLWQTVKKIGHWVAYGLAFVGGLLHGFVKSLWDAIAGLVTMAKDVLVSIFTGSVLSDAKELWDAISGITWQQIKDAVGAWADEWGAKLNSPSPWVAGHAHGYLTGYIMAEAAQLLLTGGALAEAKAALWGSRLGKAIKATRAFRAFEEGLAKAGEVGSKAREAIGAAASAVVKSRAFTVLADARRWVGKILALSAETLEDLTLPAINRLRTLSDDAIETLRRLAEPFKRVLLGCASPCKVDLEVIKTYLASLTGKAATGVKKLETIDDILAALPEKMEKSLIKSKLKAHPAFVEAFKKAEVTADDLAVIEKFLTPADLTNPKGAYETFTRTLSSLIPAKVGRDIEKLNAIAEAIVLLEPRWGSAFKGPMFESFAKLHLGRFRNLSFSRATWEKAAYKSLSKVRRTSDGFIESSRALWEFKHTVAKVPIDQVDDYFKILTRGMESSEGLKAKSVNFLFATKEGAEANADLVKKGFNVFYVKPPDVVSKL
jgi:hypothetical protein